MFKFVIADVLDLYQIYCLKVPINDWTFVNSFELLEYSHLNLSRFFTVQLSMFLAVLFVNSSFILSDAQLFVNNFFLFIFRRFISNSATNFDILSYHYLFVNNFLSAFSSSELYNSMCLTNQPVHNSMPYHPCQHFFTFISLSFSKTKRRGWDSNPRALSDKRFSRPPRYDHFDTSPY